MVGQINDFDLSMNFDQKCPALTGSACYGIINYTLLISGLNIFVRLFYDQVKQNVNFDIECPFPPVSFLFPHQKNF